MGTLFTLVLEGGHFPLSMGTTVGNSLDIAEKYAEYLNGMVGEGLRWPINVWVYNYKGTHLKMVCHVRRRALPKKSHVIVKKKYGNPKYIFSSELGPYRTISIPEKAVQEGCQWIDHIKETPRAKDGGYLFTGHGSGPFKEEEATWDGDF